MDPLLIESELAHFGLFPDEGPSAGGPHSPYVDPPDFYRTSRQLAEQMVKEHSSGEVYRCFCARNMQSSVVEDRFVACGNECDKIPPEVSRKLSKRRRSMIRLKAAGMFFLFGLLTMFSGKFIHVLTSPTPPSIYGVAPAELFREGWGETIKCKFSGPLEFS